MDQFILECLNVDSKEDAANEKDGKTIDQVANYCIEKFREEEEDGAIGKYRFGGLFEVCKGAREQRVPQRVPRAREARGEAAGGEEIAKLLAAPASPQCQGTRTRTPDGRKLKLKLVCAAPQPRAKLLGNSWRE